MTTYRHTPPAESRYPQSELRGTVSIIGDIVGPVVPEHCWDSLAGARSPGQSAGEDESESSQGTTGGAE